MTLGVWQTWEKRSPINSNVEDGTDTESTDTSALGAKVISGSGISSRHRLFNHYFIVN